ncbi:unnamed protein product, partial [Mesorhabditis spiculigera]
MNVANWWLRLSWRLRSQLYNCGIIPGPVELSPIQWKEEPSSASIPRSYIEALTTEQRDYYLGIEREVRLLSRLLPLFPSAISESQWKHLSECQNMKQRLEQLKFYRKIELQRERDAANRAERRDSKKANPLEPSTPHESFIYYNPAAINRLEKNMEGCREARAYQTDDLPILAVDCRYLKDLSPRGASLTGAQLKILITGNRDFAEPWPLYFLNWDEKHDRYEALRQKYLMAFDSSARINGVVSPKNYVDIFDAERVVYMSPHAEEEIEKVEAGVTYVLGGIVDRVKESGISPTASADSAHKDGVRCQKLPLDRYLTWKSGTRYLTLPAVQAILHDVHENGGDWHAAFEKHIPKRNLRGADEKNEKARLYHQAIRVQDRNILQMVEKRLR